MVISGLTVAGERPGRILFSAWAKKKSCPALATPGWPGERPGRIFFAPPGGPEPGRIFFGRAGWPRSPAGLFFAAGSPLLEFSGPK